MKPTMADETDAMAALVQGSFRALSDIERIGRDVARTVAEEFARHATPSRQDTADTERPVSQADTQRTGSSRRVMRDWILLVDSLADIAREGIMTSVDVLDRVAPDDAPPPIDITIDKQTSTLTVPFWLHSIFSTEEVEVHLTDLVCDSATLPCRLLHPRAQVRRGEPASFELVLSEIDKAAPVVYRGQIYADLVAERLDVIVRVKNA